MKSVSQKKYIASLSLFDVTIRTSNFRQQVLLQKYMVFYLLNSIMKSILSSFKKKNKQTYILKLEGRDYFIVNVFVK